MPTFFKVFRNSWRPAQTWRDWQLHIRGNIMTWNISTTQVLQIFEDIFRFMKCYFQNDVSNIKMAPVVLK